MSYDDKNANQLISCRKLFKIPFSINNIIENYYNNI